MCVQFLHVVSTFDSTVETNSRSCTNTKDIRAEAAKSLNTNVIQDLQDGEAGGKPAETVQTGK